MIYEELDKEKISKIRDKVDIDSEKLEEIVNDIIKPYCEDLDKYVDFIKGILTVAGIDDAATFERSAMINVSEEVTGLIQAASYLPEEYVTKKLLAIFGDADKTEEILRQIEADELNRFRNLDDEDEQEEDENENQQR